ncbi:hypothetical protein RN001_002511 [Aquatica leii]|uniref:Uncharacterized protein n=1 Tax=Aquatica leii TaxID=1421715 RepID=A0AAN7PDJ7_9COLE|nr:hypothetical protein RN001_002511 [Aquatica leii]
MFVGGIAVRSCSLLTSPLIDDCSRMDGWTIVVITYNSKAKVSEMSLRGVLEGILINSGQKLGRSFRVWESGDYHLILTTPLAPIL